MKTLFVIDDDPGPLQALVEMFEARYVVLTASDINTALARLLEERTPVDLIITDFHVGTTGTATHLISAIREAGDERLRRIPIIGFSAEAGNRDFFERQGYAFFDKPLKQKAELIRFVEERIGA